MSLVWQGVPTTTTARVVVQSDSSGQLSATVNGSTFTGDTVDPSVDDGVGKIDITGLSAGHSYECVVKVGSTTIDTITVKTFSEGRVKVRWFSCINPMREFFEGRKMATEDFDLSVVLGDMPYTDTTSSNWGYACPSVITDLAAATNEENYWPHYKRSRAVPGLKALFRAKPVAYIHDDHEAPGDDWDNSVAGCNNVNASLCTDLDDVAAINAVWPVVAGLYEIGNPANSDSGIDNDAKYFRFTIWNTEFFVLDCISYRSAVAATDDATKTMLGSNQKTWLKAKLLASTATFKVVFSPKSLVKINGGNGDTWNEYQTERNEVLQYIHDNSVTGVFWGTGDQHRSHVTYSSTTAGDDYDHVSLCACPLTTDINGTISAPSGFIKSMFNSPRVYGEIETTDDYLEARLVRADDNAVLWRGRVYAGENTVSYPDKTLTVS